MLVLGACGGGSSEPAPAEADTSAESDTSAADAGEPGEVRQGTPSSEDQPSFEEVASAPEPGETLEASRAELGGPPPLLVPHGGDPAAFGPPLPSGDNLLLNPSFEFGVRPWYVPTDDKGLWAHFDLATDVAFTGEKSVRLALDSREFGERTYGVFGPSQGASGLRQDLDVDRLPRYLRARYRLERWERATPAQYFHVVVGVNRAGNMGLFRKREVETAFVLGGVDKVPTDSRFRRFVFLGPADATELVGDEWREVEVDLHKWFDSEWGAVPAGFDRCWVQVEIRFDTKVDHRIGYVDDLVLFDDLYLGN